MGEARFMVSSEQRAERKERNERCRKARPSLPNLHLQTRAETVAKTFMGRLLLGGRRADEPEDGEKVYLWFVVL
jgi:hypothetical protein